MNTKLENFIKTQLKTDLPDIRPGDTVQVYQKIKETPKKGKKSEKQEEKPRIQVFEGLVIARKHGKGMPSTITVRKIVSGVGVERIFPVHSPMIEKIEIVKRGKVRRAKLYYLRTAKGRKARLKKRRFTEAIAELPLVEAVENQEEPDKEKVGETEEAKEEKTEEPKKEE